MKPQETVTIPLSEYTDLQQDSIFLECLRMSGVDNWEWYDEACRLYRERDLDND
jgi:hypothetical protein